MVKRKKNGPGTLEDDKRNDEGASSSVHVGEVSTCCTENSESGSCISSQSKNRIHVTRTSTKETQGVHESSESDNGGNPTEKNQKLSPVIRYSNRAPKRLRKETSPSDTGNKKTVVTLKQNAPLRSKARRPWELWSVEDKNSFFEALCEFGKDFESIQSYIAQRSKKKGIPANMIKNKDQVRHFYYRTWHKISKYLEIGDDVRKQTQEIYGLINYAELRKKIGGCLNEKNRQKLNELVFNGVTTVKYKGKKLRIKTPVCRALKKLNNVSESKEPEVEKLPKDIVVELRPHTNHAWLHVQNLAQNPRVRTKISLQRRLKSVIEYLQNKWKPSRLKRKEQILSSLSQLDDSAHFEDPPPVLRVKPQNDSQITTLSISTMDSASSSDVCLEKYLRVSRDATSDKETVRKKNCRLKPKLQIDCENLAKTEQNTANKVPEGETPDCSFTDCERNTSDNYSINLLTPPKSVEESEDCTENAVDDAQRSLSLLSSMLNPVDNEIPIENQTERTEVSPEKSANEQKQGSFNCITIEEMFLNTCQEGEMLTLGQLLSLGSRTQFSSPEPEGTKNDNQRDDISANPLTENLNEKSVTITSNSDEVKTDVEDLKNGWTLENVGLLTVGELYLMLGRPAKIILEYEFDPPIQDKVKDDEIKANNDVDNSSKSTVQELADVMRKLIQMASSTFVEFKNKQTPLSPTYRNISHTRTSAACQPPSKANSRCTAKNTNVKTVKTTKSLSVNIKSTESSSTCTGTVASLKNSDSLSKAEVCSTTNSLSTVCSDGMQSTSDSHVFVVPVGTAPRVIKKPTQESLREEIDKLLPSTRRGCRVRRKPLVVQRPLLPRDGIGTVSGPRPMTVVHLVPSGSQLTAVIPSSCTGADNKPSVLPSKKVMKILSTGPPIDVRPLQVPLLKQVSTDSNVILHPKSISGPHLVVTPATSQNIQAVEQRNVNTIINAVEKNTVVITSDTSSLPNMPDAASLSSPISLQKIQPLSTMSEGTSLQAELIASSPPQISIPESTSSSSTENVSPFLEISMVGDVAHKDISADTILDFSGNSTLSPFVLPPGKPSPTELLPNVSSPQSSNTVITTTSENTPPQSPPSRPFRINSPGPEAQWLNGESVEFSLNTLLNTLESPCKVLPVSSSMNLANENSNLDPITRLAPVVDSQVRCLLEECSVDFIAKFEDLADVINSSNNDSKPA